MLAALALASCLAAGSAPAVAILIDDIGYRIDSDLAALGLPGAYSYAILPHAPHGRSFVLAARALTRDSLLHLPMEAEQHNALLGPGALTHDMSETERGRALNAALASLPGVVGLNNHMGSRLTADASAMRGLAARLARHRDFFFVDSRTTPRTVAATAMRERSVPTLERDVFLDNVRRPGAIRRQLDLLVARAKRQGQALGIAHPYRETLDILRAWRPANDEVQLVPISHLLGHPPGVQAVTCVK